MPVVYKLINPVDNTVYYIGFTSQSLQARLIGHIYIPKHPTTRNIISLGLIPLIEAIKEGPQVTKLDELNAIKEYLANGYKLENIDGLVNYQSRDALFTLPPEILDNIGMSEIDKYREYIKIALNELPENSSIPLVIRLRFILSWALKTNETE